MIPEPITINGRSGTVVYLDAQWHPVQPAQATMARVLFDDGGSAFYTVQEPTQKREYVRDEKGQFAEVYHGTAENRLDSILKEGLTLAHAGEMWPGMSHKDSVYITTDEKSATSWAEGAASHERWNSDEPAVVVLKVRIPLDQESKLTIDTNLEEDPDSAKAWQFKGSIKPEWIVGAKIGRQNRERIDRYGNFDLDWTEVPLKKAAQDGQIIYVVVVLQSSAEKREYVRDEKGQFAETEDRQLQGDEEDDELFLHGTTEDRLKDILREGLLVRHSGEVWPDFSQRDKVYLTTNEDDAQQWAEAAAHRTEANAIAILKVRVPVDQMSKLTRDTHFKEGDQRQFKGSIPPEWIVEAKIGRYSDDPSVDFHWEDVSLKIDGQIMYVVLVLQSSAEKKEAFDESKHPRHPEGSPEGGQFTETGRAGEATPDPVLAKQAKDGIAAVEKLIPEAVKTADYSGVELKPTDWDQLDESTQNKVQAKWEEHAWESIYVDTSTLDRETRVELRENNQEVLDDAVKETLSALKSKFPHLEPTLPLGIDQPGFHLYKTLDPETLDYGEGTDEDGIVALDREALRFTDGTPLTDSQKDLVEQHWGQQYSQSFDVKFTEALESSDYYDKKNELERKAIDDEWESMNDSSKLDLLESYDITPHREIQPGEPDQWVTGVEEGTLGESNYAQTHAVALRLTELRTDQLRKERKLLGEEKPVYTVKELGPEMFAVSDDKGNPIAVRRTAEEAKQRGEAWADAEARLRQNVGTGDLIQAVWSQWKTKSSEGLSLSLQLAAAQELNGHHRMTEQEVQDALEYAKDYGGIETLQAYVRAQWEVTQTIMAKAKQDKVQVYRGIYLPGEKVDSTTQVMVDKHGKPLQPATNIQSTKDRHAETGESIREYVSFDFNGKHYQVEKRRKSTTSWQDVDNEIKQKVAALFLADEKRVAKELGQPEPTGVSAFGALSGWSRYDLWKGYVASGRLPNVPFESDEEAVHQKVLELQASESGRLFAKLPELSLKRAGAQSTTGTASVANQWGGVGNLPPDPVRVVIRIEAPSTSVLSLPVYGQNVTEEHESVLLGTKDKWLWDAWRDRAPGFEDQSVSEVVPVQPIPPKPAKPKSILDIPNPELEKMFGWSESMAHKAEKKPLVIDLQEEDRGKPHWMSSVDWAAVQSSARKFEEAKHPRDKEGKFTESGQGEKTGAWPTDKEGRLIAYHGTVADFSAFDEEKIGTRTDSGFFGRGIYFTQDTEQASGGKWTYRAGAPTVVMEVRVDVKNPFHATMDDMIGNNPETAAERTAELQAQGYDGIITDNGWLVAFKASQVTIVNRTRHDRPPTEEEARAERTRQFFANLRSKHKKP